MKDIGERNNMEEWKKIKISDIGRIVTGKTPRTSIKENYGGYIPFLTPSDDLSNKFAPITNKVLTDKGLMEVRNCLLPENSICVSCIGSDLGKVVMLKKPTVTNQQFNSIIPNENYSPDFVYYLMIIVGKRLNFLSKTSTAVPIINKSTFSNFEVEVPSSLRNQTQIAKILSSLDDKIELNNRINANLEEQAQTLFRRWFVDFEFPNEQGLPYKSNGGAFIDSELGRIPKDWKVGNLFSIATLFDSKRKPLSNIQRASRKGKYPYYGATSVMDYVDDYLFDDTFLLMGEDGSVVNEQGYPFLQYVTGKFWANNHAHIMQGKNGVSTEMLYCMMKMTNISNLVTGAVQAKLSQTNMNKILFPLATKDILKYFSKMIEPLYAFLRKNVCENQTLIQQRDSLLPKLMNNEI